MSRTDTLRQGGGKERGGMVGGTPFVKWGDDYTWIEGRVEGTFETKYGLAATFKVSAVHDGGLTAHGKNEDGEEFTLSIRSGDSVNVGMASAALKDKIEAGDVGKRFHVAMEGWEHPKGGGNSYRIFAVIELTERTEGRADEAERPEIEPTDDIPF